MTAMMILDTPETHKRSLAVKEKYVVDGAPTTETWQSAEFAKAEDVRTGIWAGDAGSFTVASYPNDEVFTILSGKVELIGADGTTLTVGPGESCLVRKGWAGTWRTVERARKMYVSFQG